MRISARLIVLMSRCAALCLSSACIASAHQPSANNDEDPRDQSEAFQLLRFASDGYRANEQRISEVVARGTRTRHETRTGHGRPLLDSRITIDFTYQRSGDLVRCDRTWRRTKHPEGPHTQQGTYLRTRDYFLDYGQPDHPLVLRAPDRWDIDLDIFDEFTMLSHHSTKRNPAVAFDYIREWLLRQPKPEEYIAVSEEMDGAELLLHFSIKGIFNEDKPVYEIWIAPDNGFLPTRVINRRFSNGFGGFESETERTIIPRPVGGAWFPATARKHSVGTRGTHETAEIRTSLALDELRINEGLLRAPDEVFSLDALELPPGTTIIDHRFRTSAVYTAGQLSITEAKLRAMLRASDNRPCLGDSHALRVSGLGDVYYSRKSLCGATSLWTILRALGQRVTLSDVTARCAIRPEGTSLESLREAAQSFGLHTKTVRTNVETLRDAVALDGQCAILFVGNDHFVGVLDRLDSTFDVADYPNRSWVGQDGLVGRWAGVALLMSTSEVALPTGLERGIDRVVALGVYYLVGCIAFYGVVMACSRLLKSRRRRICD